MGSLQSEIKTHFPNRLWMPRGKGTYMQRQKSFSRLVGLEITFSFLLWTSSLVNSHRFRKGFGSRISLASLIINLEISRSSRAPVSDFYDGSSDFWLACVSMFWTWCRKQPTDCASCSYFSKMLVLRFLRARKVLYKQTVCTGCLRLPTPLDSITVLGWKGVRSASRKITFKASNFTAPRTILVGNRIRKGCTRTWSLCHAQQHDRQKDSLILQLVKATPDTNVCWQIDLQGIQNQNIARARTLHTTASLLG